MTDISPQEHPQARLDRAFMFEALEQARRAGELREVPVGAVVVSPEGRVVARAFNSPIALNDPTAHAEILALRQAAAAARNYRLNGYTMYVTIEPCLMCAGALLHARIARLVFGAADPRAGAVSSLYRTLQDDRLNHRLEVTGGVLGEECARIMRDFFQARR